MKDLSRDFLFVRAPDRRGLLYRETYFLRVFSKSKADDGKIARFLWLVLLVLSDFFDFGELFLGLTLGAVVLIWSLVYFARL